MRRVAVLLVAAVVLCGASLAACAVVVGSTFVGAGGAKVGEATGTAIGTEPVAALSGIGQAATALAPAVPSSWEAIDQAAASTCRGLAWPILAAIGRVESNSGRSTLPGVASGANAYGAEGPMQFEPATFSAYAVVGPGGAVPASPYDPVDAVYTAARMLCANGAARQAGLYGAVWDYDHSVSYVETVLVLARSIGTDPALGSAAASAIAFAAEALGTPYLWGGTGAGGYDCSGLVQAAYRSAGIALPRVAQTQFDAGPRIAPGSPVEPGDLVFFGASARTVSHVGIVVGTGVMIDAPDTGTVVRVQDTPTRPGAPWGSDVVVGETNPAG